MNIGRRTSAWLLVGLSASTTAWAQTDTAAQRSALVEQAVAARDAGDHVRALALFTQAGQIEMRPGLRASLAQERRQLSQPREACHEAARCVTEATADLSRPETAHVLQECSEVVAAVCRQFGQVRIALPTPSPSGMHISVEDQAYDPAQEGDTVVVDPGMVSVRATANGMAEFRASVSVGAGETRPVTVTMRSPAQTPVLTIARLAPAVAPPDETHNGSTLRTVGWVGLVGGGLLAVTGSVILGVRQGQIASGTNANCHVNNGVANGPSASNCQSVYDTTQTMEAAGLGLTIGGAAVGVVGLIVALVSGSGSRESERTPTASLRCGVGPGVLGVSCGGAF